MAERSISVTSSVKLSVWCCSLICERRLDEGWGKLGGFPEEIQDPLADVWSLGS